MLERWQGDRLWSQLARERSCWTLELHPFPIKPIAPKYCQAKRKSLIQPSNVVFCKKGWRCSQRLHHTRAPAGQTPSSAACATKMQSAQRNTSVFFFFFLAGETASLTGGWMPLHTVFHLLSCWSSGCRLRAQQMVLRGDLHMQSILEITWVISTEMEEKPKKQKTTDSIYSLHKNTLTLIWNKQNKLLWGTFTWCISKIKMTTTNKQTNKLNFDGLNWCPSDWPLVNSWSLWHHWQQSGVTKGNRVSRHMPFPAGSGISVVLCCLYLYSTSALASVCITAACPLSSSCGS